ncbi:MAG: CotH kinase family protein [Clostridia bacterium]|nr:CotH kinase family protein [Clostridia bacterium]
MKRKIALALLVCMVMSVFALPVSAVEDDIMAPGDIAKVLIYTDGGVEIPSNKEKVACEIYIVDQEGGIYETIHGENCTVNVRGNSTSSAYKKPYNIKFDSKTDVLGMGKNKKWSLLANCYDKTLLRNAVVMDFAKELGVPYTPDYKYVDVYVNDELQGSYLLIDSVEVSETRVDIDLDNNEYLIELDYNTPDPDCYYLNSGVYGISFAINEPEIEDITDEQTRYVENLIYEAEYSLGSDDFDEICEYFDIESMAKFYVTLEYFRNIDVATSSTRFHIKGGKIYGGPVWDFDLSSGNYNVDYYGTGTLEQKFHATKMKWFKALVEYPEFQELVNKYFLEMQDTIVNLYTDNLLGKNKIDSMIETYGASFDRNHNEAGWDPSVVHHSSMQLERHPDETYEENVEFYRNWLLERNEWLLETWGLTSFVEIKEGSALNEDAFIIKGLSDEIPVSEFLGEFVTENVTVSVNGEALADDAYVPNGAIVSCGGASYGTLVLGDVQEDGVVNQYDYIMVKRAYFKTVELDDLAFAAADVDGDGEILTYDYIAVKRHYFGTIDIYEVYNG